MKDNEDEESSEGESYDKVTKLRSTQRNTKK